MKISGSQIETDTGYCIDLDTPSIELAVKILAGYHNYFRVDVFAAVEKVNAQLTENGLLGWTAHYSWERDHIPAGAIRVGQVTVRSGEGYPLYVTRTTPHGRPRGWLGTGCCPLH